MCKSLGKGIGTGYAVVPSTYLDAAWMASYSIQIFWQLLLDGVGINHTLLSLIFEMKKQRWIIHNF